MNTHFHLISLSLRVNSAPETFPPGTGIRESNPKPLLERYQDRPLD
jgi:hypothetical protein